MKNKDINNALQQKLGDMYQYFVVALDLFEITDAEKIEIEVHGDITIYTPDKTIQKEVKHHLSDKKLTNKDTDFWKTLYNWLVVKNHNYDELVLFTTDEAAKSSVFDGWNYLNSQERFDLLINIPYKNNSDKRNFNFYYSKIFVDKVFSEEDIKSVVSKIKIIQGSNNIYDISKKFYKYLTTIDDDQKDNIIIWILGYIIKQCSVERESWTIDKKMFFEDLKKEIRLLNRQNTIPDDYMYKTISSEYLEKYKEHSFVKKINEIKLENRITDAINDYWRAQRTIMDYFSSDAATINKIRKYSSEIDNMLRNSREKNYIRVEGKNDLEVLKQSKEFFYDMMSKEAIPVDGLQNYSFFQHGVIHTVMDENDIKWYLGEKNENKKYD